MRGGGKRYPCDTSTHGCSSPDHVHPYYQKLFETGVDEMSWDDMDVMQVCLCVFCGIVPSFCKKQLQCLGQL